MRATYLLFAKIPEERQARDDQHRDYRPSNHAWVNASPRAGRFGLALDSRALGARSGVSLARLGGSPRDRDGTHLEVKMHCSFALQLHTGSLSQATHCLRTKDDLMSENAACVIVMSVVILQLRG